MTFQTVIDYAESISIDTKQVVASTTARDGTLRVVSRGGQIWRFTVQMPTGPKWTDMRQLITALEQLDRVSSGTIQFNTSGMEWLAQYQGNAANYTGFRGSVTTGSSTLTLTATPTITSGYKFRAGDLIQIGTTGRVYKVTADVGMASNSVPLHRPVLDTTQADVALRVGPNCQFTVRCRDFPNWTIFQRDQISWDGPFVFYEVM